MRSFRKGLKRKAAAGTLAQPFKGMPLVNVMGPVGSDRINAHDLFSLYTADIIKEETVFIR